MALENIKKWNLDRWIAILGFLITIGFGGYLKSIWNSTVESAIVDLLNDQRSDVNHMIDSIANVKADAKIAHVMKQIAEEELGKSVMSEALDNFNGMDSEELKQELTEKFEFADKIMNAMESSGLKPEDMPGIYQQISQQNMMLVGPFVDNSTGAFLYRWYTGEVFPVRWGKPYDGLNNNIPYFKGPGGKIYSIPSMINNL